MIWLAFEKSYINSAFQSMGCELSLSSPSKTPRMQLALLALCTQAQGERGVDSKQDLGTDRRGEVKKCG